MPRRTKSIFPLGAIESRLNERGNEMYEWISPTDEALARRRLKGWRWNCGCMAFVYPMDAALWVPCQRHEDNR